MRVIFDIPAKVARGFLYHLADTKTEPEIIVKVRLARQRGEAQSPDIVWQVEFLPNNGGIYGRLLEGGNK